MVIEKQTLLPIEKDVINWYINEYACLRELIPQQLDYIENIERGFTGQGVFANFTMSSKLVIEYNPIDPELFGDSEARRFSGLGIVSSEFECEAPVDLILDLDGKLDYIEFCYGLQEKKYPTQYYLNRLKEHIIYVRDY